MEISDNLMMLFQIGTGLFWGITYILIIKKGFEDKTYGMPMVAMCANISWEFIFSFIYPHQGIQLMVNISWLLLDSVIMIQFFCFGWKDFKKYLPLKYFFPTFFLTFCLSFLIIMKMSTEFNDTIGMYAAFSQNFMMSVLFVALIVKRGNTEAQSIYIGIFKMIGSIIPAIAFYLYYQSAFINLINCATFIFDVLYIILLIKMSCTVSSAYRMRSIR